MMARLHIALILAISLLALGCTGPASQAPPAQETPAAQEPVQSVTCQDVCEAQPHIQCVGSWSVSGTYPDCACTYECETEEVVEPEAPPEEPAEPEAPLPEPEVTQKSVPQMLEDGLADIRDGFYRSHDGEFLDTKYTYSRVKIDPDVGQIIIGVPNDVKFDGEWDEGIVASGFYLFMETDEEVVGVEGLAIFQAKATLLDSYSAMDAFDIDYFPDFIDKELRDCYVDEKVYNKNENGDWLVTYGFQCEKALDK